MTLQNRLALDWVLVKEEGVCGYLKLDKEHCCIHIPNITDNLQEQLDKMRKVAEDSRAIRDAAEDNWLNKILQGLNGWSLKGWLATLLEGIICVVVIILGICIGCAKRTIEKNIWK